MATDTIPANAWALAALIIVTLCGVILWQQRRIDKAYEKNSVLQDARLADVIANRDKYDMVMGKFSQSFDLFVAKLEATKGGKPS